MSCERLIMPSLEAHALWARTYDSRPNPILQLEERTVRKFLHPERSQTILDAGCGTGRWLEKFVQQGIPAAGVDLSPEMLRQGQGRGSVREHLVQADCRSIPLRTASVSLVISSFCIGYVPDLSELAREFARVTQNAGHLIVSDLHPLARSRGWTRSFRHDRGVVEILSFDHPVGHILETFGREGFELLRCLEPSFTGVDGPLFGRCGRDDLFLEVVDKPAIVVCWFKRAQNRVGREALDDA